jgi:hypothetical protein
MKGRGKSSSPLGKNDTKDDLYQEAAAEEMICERKTDEEQAGDLLDDVAELIAAWGSRDPGRLEKAKARLIERGWEFIDAEV